jgi:hypothetical protein
MAWSCEHGNKTRGSVNVGEFFIHLSIAYLTTLAVTHYAAPNKKMLNE